MDFKLLALILLCLINLYRLWKLLLERRSFGNPIPANVSDVYDRDTYLCWKKYSSEKSTLEIFHSIAGFILSFLLLLLNAHSAVEGILGKGMYPALLSVSIFDTLVSWLADIPFGWIDTMKIEEKYGFNRSSSKTFVADQLKQAVISLIIACGLACLLALFHTWLGAWLIAVFACALFAIVLIITFLYPVFSRIFNKFTPLEDGELKERLTALLTKNGYSVRAIQVMDASRRSSKSNAYFTGFGKMKTIVLYDTLVSSMTADEIVAVFAHEMGHGLNKDTLKGQALSILQVLMIACLAWLTVSFEQIYTDFGFESVNYGFAMILVGIEMGVTMPLFGMFSSWVSRRHEYRADLHAVKEGCGEALISGLKKLSHDNFANLAPSPVIVRLEYSHPTMSQRIEAIENAMKK
ncbi:MAG: M48 family metallopeptidase [Clostridiales bacterium]|nr:M48 family metallopeptidase [Clostridiales bacterium]